MILTAAMLFGHAAARETYTLNDGWRFYFGNEPSGDGARAVTLPHSWNDSPGSLLRTTADYDRSLFVPAEWEGRRLFLRFGGAGAVTDVFVNGYHVGEHYGAYTAFTFEITDRVRFGEDNLLHVVVSNAWRSDVMPASTDQNICGGLTRGVELLVTSPAIVSPLHLGSDGVLIHPKKVSSDRVEAEAEVHLSAPAPTQCAVTVRVLDGDGYAAALRTVKAKVDRDKTVTVPFVVDNPALWSPSQPSLYRVEVVVTPDGGAADTVAVRTGFRDIAVSAAGGLSINGRRTDLRGVRLFHDRAGRGGVLTDRDFDADLELLRDLGANAVRSEGGPHAPYLYDRCDETGVVAWVDLPFTRAPYLSDVGFYDTERFLAGGRRQLDEIIAQNINHPSVAMWGIFSLLRPHGDEALAYIRELNARAKAADASRPTVACSNRNGDINFITDLIVWQQNVGWERGMFSDVRLWNSQLSKNWSHLASGATWGEEGDIDVQEENPSRTSPLCALFPEGRQTAQHEEYAAALCGDTLFWGVWINSLADYASDRHSDGTVNTGLVTADRARRKDAYYLYRALWNTGSPTLHIAGRNLRRRSDAEMALTVYSSAGEPLLVVGGDTVAVREASACRYVTEPLRLEGRTVVRASAGDASDEAVFIAGSPLVRKSNSGLRKTAGLRMKDSR